MNQDFVAAMRRATVATRAMNLAEATAIIRQALGADTPAARADAPLRNRRSRVRGAADPVADAEVVPDRPMRAAAGGPFPRRRRLGDVVRTLREGRAALARAGRARRERPAIDLPLPDGATFEPRHFACAAGSRNYRLYVPASASEGLAGLVVMLHGCTQSPEDFAAGTGMNRLAETHRLLVAYPAQTRADNAMSCWNWFRPSDQARDAGEPAIIAGLTAALAAEFAIPADRLFVAGLSAGGAMAAVMAATYPEFYAAVGVHSGLAHGSASDVVSAFAAMRGEPGLAAPPADRGAAAAAGPRVIVFHGGADRTVHPGNAERIAAAARRAVPGAPRSERGLRGRSYLRTVAERPDGTPAVEVWMIDGAGHAWSGGDPAGSYTDPHGPDASAEMVRFFLGG